MADSRMRALWLQDGRLSYRPDAPRPTPGADDVLVRVLKAGVCSTDTGLEQLSNLVLRQLNQAAA